jgi:hypothetical protein
VLVKLDQASTHVPAPLSCPVSAPMRSCPCPAHTLSALTGPPKHPVQDGAQLLLHKHETLAHLDSGSS